MSQYANSKEEFIQTKRLSGKDVSDFIIEAGNYESKYLIEGVNFKANNIIKEGYFKNLIIKSSQGLRIEGGIFESLTLDHSDIEIAKSAEIVNLYIIGKNVPTENLEVKGTININYRDKKTQFSYIKNIKANRLEISNGFTDSIYKITNIEVNELILENLKANRPNTIIVLDNVSLGKTKKYNVKFNNISYESIKFKNCNFKRSNLLLKSDFGKIESYNTTWFKKIYENESRKENREIYRKFKIAMIEQHDRINELYFKAKELNSHKNNLPFGWDKFLLIINRITNNYALNWWLPAVWFLVLGFAFFFFYSLSADIPINEIFGNKFGYYWYFLNPTHKIEIFDNSIQYTNWNYGLDFFHRITSYFFIYQFIAAFRKFGARIY